MLDLIELTWLLVVLTAIVAANATYASYHYYKADKLRTMEMESRQSMKPTPVGGFTPGGYILPY